MKPKNNLAGLSLTGFLIFLTADLIFVGLSISDYRIISKGGLMIWLFLYFYFSVTGIHSSLKKWIMLALFFSWAGDLLLHFESHQSVFFLLGLSSFLLAHVCYIIFFHFVRMKESVSPKPLFLLLILPYYIALLYLLAPTLGQLDIPVRVYAIVICFMYLLALHLLYIPQKQAGRWMMLGALFFVISDSILAINRFYQPFFPGNLLVMLTYGIAQLMIVSGAIRYLLSNTVPK